MNWKEEAEAARGYPRAAYCTARAILELLEGIDKKIDLSQSSKGER